MLVKHPTNELFASPDQYSKQTFQNEMFLQSNYFLVQYHSQIWSSMWPNNVQQDKDEYIWALKNIKYHSNKISKPLMGEFMSHNQSNPLAWWRTGVFWINKQCRLPVFKNKIKPLLLKQANRSEDSDSMNQFYVRL